MTSVLVSLRSVVRRLGAEVGAFSAWWLQELRDIWAALVESMAPRSSQRFIVDLTGECGVLKALGDGMSPERRFTLHESMDLPSLAEIWPEGAPDRARVTVLLPDAAVLTCRLRIPPIPERDVGQAVALQLERELPLTADQVYVDWRLLSKSTDRSRVIVVAIARRTVVDAVRHAIGSWGWRVVAVDRKSDDRTHFNLLPAPVHRLSFAMGKRETYLAWSGLALCVAYILLGAGQWWYERFSLIEPLQNARSKVTEIRAKRTELIEGSKPVIALRDLMSRQSSAQALAGLSDAIPGDAWIYQMDIRTPSSDEAMLSLEGYAHDATAVVGALERSAQFERVELVESSSTDAGQGLDRIELKARVSEAHQNESH